MALHLPKMSGKHERDEPCDDDSKLDVPHSSVWSSVAFDSTASVATAFSSEIHSAERLQSDRYDISETAFALLREPDREPIS